MTKFLQIILFSITLFTTSFVNMNAQQCAQFGEVYLGEDTTLCNGQVLQLDLSAHSGYISLVWENNSTSPIRTINSAGEYSVEIKHIGDNLIVNGDFEQGNTGFYTEYSLGTGGSWGQLSNEETYAINTSPSNVHNNFSYCGDHTSGSGNMMIVNGSGTPGKKVWCQNINVEEDTDYEFSTWVTNALYDNNVAMLQFTINDIPLGDVFSPSTYGCDWSQFFEEWNSGIETNIEVCITNLNINNGGNDFAIDDIYFAPICKLRDTIEVEYLVTPSFTLPSVYNGCDGLELELDAENPGLTYQWNTGAQTQTITIDETGDYSVEVSHDGLCSNTKDFEVIINDAPIAGQDASFDYCNTEDNVDLFTLLPADITQDGHWIDENGNTILDGIITIGNNAYTSIYKYIVTKEYCPSDTASYTINVMEYESAGNNATVNLCNSDAVNLNQYINGGAPGGSWSSLDGFNGGRLNQNSGVVNLEGLNKNNYQFEYTIDNEAPCEAHVATITVAISELANVDFTSSTIEGCSPLLADFYDLTEVNGTKEFSWFINDDFVSDNNSFSNTFEQAQCYDIKLRVTTDNLCVSEKVKENYICVNPDPIAKFSFSPTEVYSDDPVVQFENESELNSQNFWNFGNLGTSNEYNPSFTFPLGEEFDYMVSLVVTSDKGCIDSVTNAVPVKNHVIFYIPNAFTPDGNEYNPIFKPIISFGVDPDFYEFYIYNRWGELMFESYDLNEGWDGSHQGYIAPDGVYVWKIILKEARSDNMIMKTGTVTLIK